MPEPFYGKMAIVVKANGGGIVAAIQYANGRKEMESVNIQNLGFPGHMSLYTVVQLKYKGYKHSDCFS